MTPQAAETPFSIHSMHLEGSAGLNEQDGCHSIQLANEGTSRKTWRSLQSANSAKFVTIRIQELGISLYRLRAEEH